MFCRDMGTKEDEDDVEALEILDGGGIMVTTDTALDEIVEDFVREYVYCDNGSIQTVGFCAPPIAE